MTEEVSWLSQAGWLPDVGDVPFVKLGSHYSRAPIAEAIIEIRCTLPNSVELDVLRGAMDPQEFPEVGAHFEITNTVDISKTGVKGGTSAVQTGFAFRRSDGLRVAKARLNGFAYSILPPYDNWESFFEEAQRNWQKYLEIATPERVTRLGVRYINRIEIPNDRIEIKDYLRTAVDVSPYLPQMITNQFLQVQIPLYRYDALATITSTSEPARRDDESVLILDIDAWRSTDIDLSSDGALAAITAGLEKLREAKNYTFEACITDATRGLII